MDTYYIYQADLYCEECGAKICDDLDKQNLTPEDPEDQYSYDSGDYPKECYGDCESDSPVHCGHCHVPFNNPLTSGGISYVLDAIKESLATPDAERNAVHECYNGTYYEGCRHVEIVRDWAIELSNYFLTEKEQDLVDSFLELTAE